MKPITKTNNHFPTLGRMLQPDNYVQNATSTQAFNRYSYVTNNPLKYTDPSGWLPRTEKRKAKAIIKAEQDLYNSTGNTVEGSALNDNTESNNTDNLVYSSINYIYINRNNNYNHSYASGNYTLGYGNSGFAGNSSTSVSGTSGSGHGIGDNGIGGCSSCGCSGELAAMNVSRTNIINGVESSQTFLNITRVNLIDGRNAQTMAKYLGKEIGLLGGPFGTRNAFIHLFGYITIALSDYMEAKRLSINHEKGEEGIDTKVDQLNNSLIFDKYYNKINSMNITFSNKYQLAIEIIKLMHIDGYYRGDPNTREPIYRFLTKNMFNKYIEILIKLNP